ncbi:MAG: stage V sporulation protein AC [Ruminiclostridium sp.]|nr:stage V sporulation protein AC [Ruminiclostridium sp.]
MKLTESEYGRLAKLRSPNSNVLRNTAMAFLVGGAICCAGQALLNIYKMLGTDEITAGTLTSVTLVFLSAVMTGFGLYDKIAKHAGAGTLVPITGFANAVVSPAMEFKTEGYVLGVGAKIFIIAGPVIVYGLAASAVYGVILFIVRAMRG